MSDCQSAAMEPYIDWFFLVTCQVLLCGGNIQVQTVFAHFRCCVIVKICSTWFYKAKLLHGHFPIGITYKNIIPFLVIHRCLPSKVSYRRGCIWHSLELYHILIPFVRTVDSLNLSVTGIYNIIQIL